jgi:ABC-type transport system involved in multi-copper enzyme maturation permease subunit
MNATVVIARRELAEKRFVLLAALAFAALACIVPFVPGVHAGQKREAIVVVSTILAVGFTLGLSTILGATIIGRDLSEGRLSFYFTRPLPAAALWFGKLIASGILIAICFAIVAAPAALLGLRAFPGWNSDPAFFPLVVLAIAGVLFLLAHVIGTFIRSRTTWIAADFVCAAIVAAATYGLSRTLLDGFAVELTNRFLELLGGFAVVAMIAAGAWQLAQGRTDRRRNHRELSLFLWTALGIAMLVAGAFVWWVASVRPADLIADVGVQEKAGPWSFLTGRARHRGDYHAAFLYNIDRGQYLRLSANQPWFSSALFSGDGRTVVWFGPATGSSREVYVAHLDSPRPEPIATRITSETNAQELSPDGSRLAVIDRDGILTIYDLATGRSLGSTRAPAGDIWAMILSFASPDTLRLYTRDRGRDPLRNEAPFRIFEYSLASKTMRETGQIPFAGGMFRLSDDHTRALTRWTGGESIELRDGRNGALLTTMTPHAPSHFGNAMFLRDGRIVASEIGRDSAMVRVFGPDGTALRDITLGELSPAYVHVDIGGDRVIITARSRGQREWSSAVVDLKQGKVLRVEPGLQSLAYGSVRSGALLCRTTSKELVAWDPITGAKRPLGQ